MQMQYLCMRCAQSCNPFVHPGFGSRVGLTRLIPEGYAS
jgi:hypothetical protein